ncbi:acriflavin resistance protein [Novosphingobium aromaticivorans DSM 12444]|uniref:Acriflavin resistance protein n=1 Tax=Novosphingobium aromaticivorans (strain ATCC 700278 / DSM 12444 / CCUG 56034 / CIP 105152 / NBRC 16084 / F199) TaxID=279238 RepID=Q2G2Z6_NOVAD|nr:efflux RND transporter permease subunit [Novosphingobium aromaticivorans]ABD24488.1 acriflavin resistance protein [Novosphingobium aromaticivorans DSM 12444]SCY26731.1 Multidrug efflux pump subunit AcrB [Novosphingobium aromaticivorans]
MNFQNISAWCIRNPVVPIVLFLGLTLAGLVSFMQMKVQDNPDIEFPMVIVSIAQPGAAPTEIENQITQRVESAVRSIAGVDTLTSTASEGNSQTMVQFKIGQDINAAVNEVKNQVDQIRSDLPEGILEPQVFKVETSSNPIAYFAVAADDMTIEQLSWFIDDTIAKRLLTVPGMAEVSRSGGVNREIAVTIDPMRMNALGVTASQVNAALRQVNINAAGGKTEVAGSRQSVRVLGNARDAYALSQTEIALSGNRTVRLKDVADVRDSYSELTSIAKFNGKAVVTFSMSRARGESDVSVYDGALEEMRKIEKEQGGKVHFELLFTSVSYTKDQYRSSMNAMVEGAVLAVIVVFFFLRDWRATIVSAIAIPLSSIPTFWVLDLMGFTLNQMSLLALGLVAGVLVDDAIVEIENIVRHMRMGKSAYQAAIDAADEIGLAVVATTFSIVAVFFPVALMPGVSGQFFKNFGLTVVISVLFSLLVARMITPMIAAYFLKAHGEAEHGGGPWMDRYMKVLGWSLDTAKAAAYRAAHPGRRFRARLRDHRLWMMGIGFGALLLTLVMFAVIPTQFFPDTDSDSSTVSIEMVPGTTLQQTEKKVQEIVTLLSKEQEVKSTLASVREAKANIYVNLKADRERSSLEFERQMTPRLQQIADVRANFQAQGPSGPGGGSGRPISIMLAGSDPELLQRTAQTLVEQMSALPLLVAPRISADLRRPEVIIKPRLDLAANLGVTTQALSQVIRIATQGEIDQNSAKFSLSDRQVPIRVKLPEDSRRDLSIIENLPVPTASGGSVPLSRVAEIGFGSGPTQIQRYNQSRRVFVGADLPPGVVKGEAMAAIMKLPIMKNLPQGVSNTAAGEDKFQAEMMKNFGIAVASGVLLVFSVLVLLYHRFISPLVNMGSLFLAPLGGLIAIWLLGQSLSLPVFIGILMLFGIVAKNSILLIDFALEEMAAGKGKLEAVMEAGHKRAQPIVMTTVAMVAGMVPTAVAIGGDSGWRAPMGIVVIGGLTLSTLLTLLIVPAGFSLADGVEKRIGPWLARKVLGYEPEHRHAATARNDTAHGAFPAE